MTLAWVTSSAISSTRFCHSRMLRLVTPVDSRRVARDWPLARSNRVAADREDDRNCRGRIFRDERLIAAAACRDNIDLTVYEIGS